MKISILAAALVIGSLSFGLDAEERQLIHEYPYTEIQTEDLKNWYDQGIEMILIDSRSEKYFSGILLPDAVWLPYNASEDSINATLPAKDAIIVVYCLSPECPMAHRLAKRLALEGYTNIYKYTQGLRDWIKAGYPTDR